MKNPRDILTALIGFSIPVFMFFQGYGYWIHYRNYNNFTGQVSCQLPAKFEAFDEGKIFITEHKLKGILVLLDFWFSRCGVCFDKFPEVQRIYEKHKNDSGVMILAVNKPIEEDKKKSAFEVIRQEGWSFPVVVADEELPERFGVKGYPTTFVIDKNGTIIFKGSIEKAESFIALAKKTP